MIQFDLPKNQSSIIKVLGIGGGGSNAVNHMYNLGIKGVDFIICNTDAQALNQSPVPLKIQLGDRGLGAGSIPSVGKESTRESLDELKQILEKNTKMLFITAGMGGGTGTGGAPVVAQLAKELDILTVGIVTIPFSFEGRKRLQQAEQGIKELREHVDTLLVISNDKLRLLEGDLKLSAAFSKADNILTTAAKGIAEIVTVTGYINVDFEDVKTVMEGSGKAIMGSATAEGETRAMDAVKEALSSPLLNDNDISGASDILLYIASGTEEISLDEVMEITDFIQEEAGQNAEIIWGNGVDDTLESKIQITIIATGFDSKRKVGEIKETEKIVHTLDEEPRLAFPPAPLAKEKKEVKVETEEPEIRLVENIKPEEKKPTFIKTRKEAEEKKEAEPTRTIVFELGDTEQDIVEKKKEKEIENTIEAKPAPQINIEPAPLVEPEQGEHPTEIEQKSRDRVNKLKELSIKLRTPGGLEEMEAEPAYVRKNVKLAETKSSREAEVSRYSLDEDGEEKSELKSNNTYLHDNVD